MISLNEFIPLSALTAGQPLEVCRNIMELDFFASAGIARSLLPHLLRGHGCFIHVSTRPVDFPNGACGALTASRRAMYGYMESLRFEHSQRARFCTLHVECSHDLLSAVPTVDGIPTNLTYQLKKLLLQILPAEQVRESYTISDEPSTTTKLWSLLPEKLRALRIPFVSKTDSSSTTSE